METAGMMSDGEVDVEAVLALLPDDLRAKNEKALRACGTQKGTDDCGTAFNTQACWQKANKADFFLVWHQICLWLLLLGFGVALESTAVLNGTENGCNGLQRDSERLF